MQLNIISYRDSMEQCQKLAEDMLGSKLRIIREEMSIFNSYRLYPGEKKFIPKLWSYRIVYKDNKYFFGTIGGLNGQ